MAKTIILKSGPIEVANQSIALEIPGEEIIEVVEQTLRLQLSSGKLLEAAERVKSIGGVPMIGVTDLVKGARESEGARRIRRAQVRNEVRKIPGVKEVKGVFMLPVSDAAEMISEHGELSEAIKIIEVLIN